MTTKMTRTGIDRLLDELQSEFGSEEIWPLLSASERWNLKSPRGICIGVVKSDDIGIT